MCDPVTLGIVAGGSALASLGGAVMQSNAQASAARATAQNNQALFAAQNQAFGERMAAQRAQTDAQLAASTQTMAERNQAASQMRQSQLNAQQRQQDILAAENQQADALRRQGDTQAQTLLAQTDAAHLAAAQDQAKQQMSLLLDQSAPQGPSPTDPQGTPGDSATSQAIATRMAQAASNVRSYGTKVAAAHSYDEPLRSIALAEAANKFGIMPAQAADTLLRSGSNIRLAPAQVAFRNAGDLGQSLDTLISSKGQNLLDAASLAAGNKISIANLGQSDVDTLAKNFTDQQKQNAAFNQSIGGIVSGIGNLGLQGTGFLAGGGNILGFGLGPQVTFGPATAAQAAKFT